NEQDSLITIRAYLNQTWNASVLAWNSTQYSNVQHFRVPAHAIWTPKIELINPSTIIDSEANHFINVHSDGHFELSYSTLLTSPCNFDMKNFPFDQQTCSFKMGSVLYGVNEVVIIQAIDFVIDEPNLMPNGYYFVSHTVDQKPVFFAGFERSYDQISIHITIHRRSEYFIYLINWPGTCLMMLTLTLFCLPPSAFERLCYGALLLVCQFILLIVFVFHLPKRLGTSWPLMGHVIFYDIMLTGFVLVCSVITRMISDGNTYSTEKPPNKMRSIFFGYLAKLVGLKRAAYAILVTNRENEYDSNDLKNNDSTMEPLTSVSNGATATTSDHLISPSDTITRDITSIKQKLNVFINEHNIQQEWILLAHIINRFCLSVFLCFFTLSITHHLFRI
ncbi:unnamed protein product, partial [Rotaria magnacalcarata]